MKIEVDIFLEIEREQQPSLVTPMTNLQAASDAMDPVAVEGRRGGIGEILQNEKKTRSFMIAADAPLIMSKACQLMVRDLTARAWRFTEKNRRCTLQKADVHSAVNECDEYDFLIDLVPRTSTTVLAPARPLTTTAPTSEPCHGLFQAVGLPPNLGDEIVQFSAAPGFPNFGLSPSSGAWTLYSPNVATMEGFPQHHPNPLPPITTLAASLSMTQDSIQWEDDSVITVPNKEMDMLEP